MQQVLPNIPPDNAKTFAETVASSLKSSLQEVEANKRQEALTQIEVNNAKQKIQKLWQNTINTRKQHFWSHHRSKRTYETFQNLLAMDPPRLPRKFLPKFIENEDPDETFLRQQMAKKKFETEIELLKLRSQKYEEKFLKIDLEMKSHFTNEYEIEIANKLIKEWLDECKKEEERSIKIFNESENFFLNTTTSDFRRETQEPTDQKTIQKAQNNEKRESIKENNFHQKRSQVPENFWQTQKPWRNNPGGRRKFQSQNMQRRVNQERRPRINPERRRLNEAFDTDVLQPNKSGTQTPRITLSATDQSETTTIIPETQINSGENDNFLWHGQGATNQNWNWHQ